MTLVALPVPLLITCPQLLTAPVTVITPGVPVVAVLCNVRVVPVLPALLMVFALGSLGVAIAGTTLSAISAQARMRELLLPVLLLPLLTPVLIASTEVTIGLLDPEPFLQWRGIGFLVAFDVIFLTALWLFGEYLLEE